MNMNANLTVMIQKMVQFSREYTYDSIDRVYVYILDTQAPPQNSYAGSCDFNCFFRSKGRICRLKEEDMACP